MNAVWSPAAGSGTDQDFCLGIKADQKSYAENVGTYDSNMVPIVTVIK